MTSRHLRVVALLVASVFALPLCASAADTAPMPNLAGRSLNSDGLVEGFGLACAGSSCQNGFDENVVVEKWERLSDHALLLVVVDKEDPTSPTPKPRYVQQSIPISIGTSMLSMDGCKVNNIADFKVIAVGQHVSVDLPLSNISRAWRLNDQDRLEPVSNPSALFCKTPVNEGRR